MREGNVRIDCPARGEGRKHSLKFGEGSAQEHLGADARSGPGHSHADALGRDLPREHRRKEAGGRGRARENGEGAAERQDRCKRRVPERLTIGQFAVEPDGERLSRERTDDRQAPVRCLEEGRRPSGPLQRRKAAENGKPPLGGVVRGFFENAVRVEHDDAINRGTGACRQGALRTQQDRGGWGFPPTRIGDSRGCPGGPEDRRTAVRAPRKRLPIGAHDSDVGWERVREFPLQPGSADSPRRDMRTLAARTEVRHRTAVGPADTAAEATPAALKEASTGFAAEERAARVARKGALLPNNVVEKEDAAFGAKRLADGGEDRRGEKRIGRFARQEGVGSREEGRRVIPAVEYREVQGGKGTLESERHATLLRKEESGDARIVPRMEIPLTMRRQCRLDDGDARQSGEGEKDPRVRGDDDQRLAARETLDGCSPLAHAEALREPRRGEPASGKFIEDPWHYREFGDKQEGLSVGG